MGKTKNVITLYTEEGEGKGKWMSLTELKEYILQEIQEAQSAEE